MTRIVHLPVLAGALAFCLATLAPLASKEAAAQVIWAPGRPQVYYDQVYYDGYGAGYNNPYQSSYGRFGNVNRGYTIYGNGPYVYGSPSMFANPSRGMFGYGNGAPYNPAYRGSGYGGGTYRRAYTPSNTRLYSPYGYERF